MHCRKAQSGQTCAPDFTLAANSWVPEEIFFKGLQGLKYPTMVFMPVIDDIDCNMNFAILTGKLSEEPDLRNKLMAASSEDGRGSVFNPEKRSNVVFPRALPVVCNDGLILL